MKLQFPRIIFLFLVVLSLSLGKLERTSAEENSAAGVGKWEPVAYVYGAVFDLSVRSPSDIWMVGNKIIHWDGKNGSVFEKPPNKLNAIDMVSATDGWAVGSQGLIMHWDGSTWTIVDSPVQDALLDIDMVSSNEGWVVGDRVVLHWNGDSWKKTPFLTSSVLTGIEMLSPDQGWAVGSVEPYGWNRIFEWNGDTWREAPVVNDDPSKIPGFNDIEMISATDGWAVGGDAYHYNGTVWLQVPTPNNSSMTMVSFASPTEGWGTGYQELLHWNGANWEAIPLSLSWSEYLTAVKMFSPSEGWSVVYNWKADVSKIVKYRPPKPTIVVDQAAGKPGSYFTIMGSNFPPGQSINMMVNGSPIGTIPADASGNFVVLLDTQQADEGTYTVTAEVEFLAGAIFIVDLDAPLLPKEIDATILTVPGGIAHTQHAYLPVLMQDSPPVFIK